eukprot:Polyplicarium_translucidae@DN2478_c1_g1_i12.p1
MASCTSSFTRRALLEASAEVDCQPRGKSKTVIRGPDRAELTKAPAVDGVATEQVDCFEYLGSRIACDGCLQEELGLNETWKQRAISPKTKGQIGTATVLGVLVCVRETVSLRQSDVLRLRRYQNDDCSSLRGATRGRPLPADQTLRISGRSTGSGTSSPAGTGVGARHWDTNKFDTT